jgi:hypothetical protein
MTAPYHPIRRLSSRILFDNINHVCYDSRMVNLSMEKAAQRVRYNLLYGNTIRTLTYEGLDGDDIPCAYEGVTDDEEETGIHQPHASSGEWSSDHRGPSAQQKTCDDWIKFWFTAVIDEAIHEALEHYHVDGKPLVDPHLKQFREKVFGITAKCGDALYDLLELDN